MSQSTVDGPGKEGRRAEPESLRLREQSVALTADDLERSMRFYVDGLGFTVRERWEEEGTLMGVDLVAGEFSLGLSQDDWSKGRDRAKGVGFRMFAGTTQNLDELALRFSDHGLEVEGPREQWGMHALTVVDPDGFKLTIYQREA
jgi:catechol 2,3-dioxygenase-like lactoylglutathione lyase family enzyme